MPRLIGEIRTACINMPAGVFKNRHPPVGITSNMSFVYRWGKCFNAGCRVTMYDADKTYSYHTYLSDWSRVVDCVFVLKQSKHNFLVMSENSRVNVMLTTLCTRTGCSPLM
jgi:hypothetical protein